MRILEQVQNLSAHTPGIALCDRGFRGVKSVGETAILIPQHKDKSADEKNSRNQVNASANAQASSHGSLENRSSKESKLSGRQAWRSGYCADGGRRF